MLDICMMRYQFFARMENWKRTVLLVRFNNIQGMEYFHDQEDPSRIETSVDVFLMTENSDTYEHLPEGAIKNIAYSGYANYDTDIQNNDFMKVGGLFFKVVELKRILEPVSATEIGKSFMLTKLEIEEDDQ